MLAMWLSTVLTVTTSRSAIAVLERPSAISASTSRSRSVSAASGSFRPRLIRCRTISGSRTVPPPAIVCSASTSVGTWITRSLSR